MESAVEEAQQGVETAASEPASQQHISPAQIAALAQVSHHGQRQSSRFTSGSPRSSGFLYQMV